MFRPSRVVSGLGRWVQGLTQFVRTLGAARLAAMAAVALTLIGFFAFIVLRATAVPMTVLFTDLSLEDSTGIIKELERQIIPYEMKNDGATLLVPQDKVTRLRMKLAEGGMPKGGGIGYEIFDKSDALGTTSFVQNINHMRALEGELSRTIRAIDRIQAARVHLVIPERPLFARDKADPSASIVLKVRGALEMQQVRAIRHMVASAVNGLKPQRISIVDETGRLLADGTADDAGRAPLHPLQLLLLLFLGRGGHAAAAGQAGADQLAHLRGHTAGEAACLQLPLAVLHDCRRGWVEVSGLGGICGLGGIWLH